MRNRIKSIDSDSPLSSRVQPGDALISINGKAVTDVLDYKFYAYDSALRLVFKRQDGSEYTLCLKKEEGGELGLNFESYLIDNPRSCANSCVFCFIDQLPKGMRKSMYFKDDDARLSFLMGNYITLTNLSEREIRRIIELRISPVNISVHSTNPELRVKMLRNPKAGESIDIMRRFAENGIGMNCQIVCCPGLNDGEELLRSLRELEEMCPAVRSVCVIPVGLTKYREGLYPLEAFTEESAGGIIDMVTDYGDGCIKRQGKRVFFCSDEMYLIARRELPEFKFYEDFPQFENGVGMLRAMEHEFMSALELMEEPTEKHNFSIATGTAAGLFFEKLVCTAHSKCDKIKGVVYTLVNDFFGHSITVAGLITGQDLIKQLKGKDLGQRLLITANMLRREERDFLDDTTLAQVERELGVSIIPVGEDGFELLDAMLGIRPETVQRRMAETDEEFYRYN